MRWLEGLTALAYGSSVLPGKIAARTFQAGYLAQYLLLSGQASPRCPGILTVYDMIHEKYPKYFASSPSHQSNKGYERNGRGSRDMHIGEYPA